jgi:oligopeptide transport system substrate-binding protein
MRKDAVWSDGKPVTAKDVEYSVKRAIKPETASPYAYVLYLIKNASAINQTAIPTDTYDIDSLGVKALDDSRSSSRWRRSCLLRVHLQHVDAPARGIEP